MLESGKYRERALIGFIGDGSPDSKTSAYYEPYPDDETNYGILFYDDDELMRLLAKVHNAGYQISVHACGVRCIEQVLTTFEQVLRETPRDDHRHRFEHFETPSESQLKRMSKAGLSASMHPQHVNLSDGYAEYWRKTNPGNMADRMIPIRSVLDAGVLVAGGSDSPVAPMAPMTAIHDCVNHPLPQNRITLYEALRMFTIDAAIISFEEDLKGTIEKGKLADLVVLSNNPYTTHPGELRKIHTEMTIVGGAVHYTKK